ncbi:four helix bundle protein [Proteiniphilum sp.]|uniref:four helix bundle protein n=1 Tax=Proteiniphilum sp. TaxID=1926877 RepID=UPI00332561B4
MGDSILKIKSYEFALLVIQVVSKLQKEQKEYILSRQIMRSGTAIGALIREAEFAQSKVDFIHKMSIALKEANETFYWISLLKDSHYIDNDVFVSMNTNCNELIALLVSIVKTSKKNLNS